ADDSEHVVTLHRPLRLSGTVVDADSGKPIEEFDVVPMIHFRPDFPSVQHDQVTQQADGAFEVELDRVDVEHGLQIEAAGYATLRVGPYRIGDEPAPLALRMKPASRFVGRVVDETGQPVAGARVFVGSYSEHLYLSDFDRDDGGRMGNYRVHTGA